MGFNFFSIWIVNVQELTALSIIIGGEVGS